MLVCLGAMEAPTHTRARTHTQKHTHSFKCAWKSLGTDPNNFLPTDTHTHTHTAGD